MTQPIFYHAHDPMCSWCWGFAPSWDRLNTALRDEYGDQLEVRYLLGGLAPDSDQPMPLEMQQYLQQTWRTIQQHIPGTEFNFDFWQDCQPRRSTWPACRAIIAARQQGTEHHASMTSAIQRAYYLNARNPSDIETLVVIAGEIGLDTKRFEVDLASEEVQAQHQQEMRLLPQLGIQGFPGMAIVLGDRVYSVPVDYVDENKMLKKVAAVLSGG